ncbi:MAG: phytanoyl-CoA dioxygenase family protein [Pseudomonadota bacterium]
MDLTEDQLTQLRDEGWVFMPDYFSTEEIAILKHESRKVFQQKRDEIYLEKNGTPRSAFAVHRYNEAFDILGRHPRLIAPLKQLWGEDVYLHQYKINAKAKFTGDVWQWHQDYGNWLEKDGMMEPRAMNISVFLDEVFPFNGPLMLIPRSHTHGVLDSTQDTQTTSFPLYTQSPELVEKLVDEGGLVVPTGKPGSMLMFDGNLVHGSSGNITPYPRNIVYLTVNACSNAIQKPTREEWLAHQDFTPIEMVADDALLRYAERQKAVA